jgi:GTPase Era involved in 16S rRNA processing
MINRTKHILVAASMSAGKSSLINALLGIELLPSGNEATTAKVARITITAVGKPLSQAYSRSGAISVSNNVVCAKQIKEWNKSEEISAFDIVLPYIGAKRHSMLAGYTLIDTPGANNSRDASHREIFIDTVKAYPKSFILYVLNATQLGTTDDAEIIRSIRENNPKQHVIFALNKVDELDDELGETAKYYVAKARKYLQGLGYTNPKVIPLMAQSALIAKKSLAQANIARREQRILNDEMARFRGNPFHLNSAADMPFHFKRVVRRRLTKVSKGKVPAMSQEELNSFLDYTGLSAITALIMGAA